MDRVALIALLQELPDAQVMVLNSAETEAYDIKTAEYDAENECITLKIYN